MRSPLRVCRNRRGAIHWPPAVLAVALTAGTGLLAAAPAQAAAAPASPMAQRQVGGPAITVGSRTLHRCGRSPLAYCGSLRVPLDYSSAASPDIRIGFRWLPATGAGRAAGTILAVEGGPGFASTGTEAEYVAQAGPLLRTRNMLLVNLRGTGGSTPVNCAALEHYGHIQAQDGPPSTGRSPPAAGS